MSVAFVMVHESTPQHLNLLLPPERVGWNGLSTAMRLNRSLRVSRLSSAKG